MLTANGATHPGRVRHVNEDAFYTDVDAGIFIVADGMGGHNAGEIASAMAIDTMRKFVVRTLSGSEFTWPFGVDPKLSFHANWLLTAAKLANRRVCRESETRDEYTGMGTTLVAALIIDQTMTIRVYATAESTPSGTASSNSSQTTIHGSARWRRATPRWIARRSPPTPCVTY